MFNFRNSMSEMYRDANSRYSGHGGGGSPSNGGHTPFFCSKCGKSVPRKKVKQSCDVCARCRARK